MSYNKELFGLLARWSAVLLFLSISISRSLFSLAVLFIFIGLIFEGRWREKLALLKNNLPALTCVALVAWIYLTLFWTKASDENYAYGANIHWKLLLIPALILLIQDEQWKHRCWQAFGLGAGILLIHIYTLNFTTIPWTSSNSPDSVFFNPLPQSVGLAIFSALCLTKMFGHPKPRRTILLSLLFIAASYAVLSISQQRLGYLMWAVGCLLVLFLKLKPLNRKWGILIALSLFMAIFFSSQKIQNRFGLAVNEVKGYQFKSDYTSVGARLHMWYASLNAVSQSPILGHGLGTYPAVAESFFQDAEMCSIGCKHPHNQYLFYFVEFGLVGLSLFLLMLGGALSIHKSMRVENTMPMVILVVFMLSGLVETTLWYRGFVYLFVPLLALSMLRPNKPSAPPLGEPS